MINSKYKGPTSSLKLGWFVFVILILSGCATIIGPRINSNSWLCGEATTETTEANCSLLASNRYYGVIGSYSGAVKPVNYAEAIPHGRGKITVGDQSIDTTFAMGDIANINLSSPDGWSFKGEVHDDLTWSEGEYETKYFKFNGSFSGSMRPKNGSFISKVSKDRFKGELAFIKGLPAPKSGLLERSIDDCTIASSGQFALNESDKLELDLSGKFYLKHPAGKISGVINPSGIISGLLEINPPKNQTLKFTRKYEFDSLGFKLRDGFLEEIFTNERFLDKNLSDNGIHWKQLKWELLQDCHSAPQFEQVGAFLKAVPLRLIITDAYVPRSQYKKFEFQRKIELYDHQPEQVLFIKYKDKASERKITERFDEKSTYVSGTREVYNPRYDVIKALVFDAQLKLSEARAADAAYEAEPCTASIFLCVMVDLWAKKVPGAEEEYNQAIEQLSRTPQMLTQDIHSDYEVGKINLTTEKTSTLVFAFFDFENGTTYREERKLKDSSNFALINSQVAETDIRKQQLLNGISSEAVVDAWLDEDIQYEFDLETLLLALRTPQNKLELAKADQMAYAKRLNSGDSSLKNLQVISTPEIVLSPKKIQSYVLEDSILVVKQLSGFGTGFYIAENLVLTNQHVIEGSTYLDLETFSGETFSGRVVATDIATDLALLEVNNAGVPLKLQDSCEVNRRESVFTIGHPRGLEYSTSRGIVSAIRDMVHPFYPESGIIKRYIQTDAAISPGNSGGPLFNSDNYVIGINTWGRNDGQNLNFSVHCSEIKNFLIATQK